VVYVDAAGYRTSKGMVYQIWSLKLQPNSHLRVLVYCLTLQAIIQNIRCG
jgi:hypothetical protein